MKARYTLEYDPNDKEQCYKIERALTADTAYSVLHEIRELLLVAKADNEEGPIVEAETLIEDALGRIKASVDLDKLWSDSF